VFGINDSKTSAQDPVMPQPLQSTEPEVSFASNHDAGTAPPLVSNPPPALSYLPTPSLPVVPANPVAPQAPANELLEIKQQALHSLAPLVDKLDQTPEEKFKTTMMMLQASDNPNLVKEAYAAANEITDEKVRAQALLDVVNEINYFTHSGAA
jgi:hypothetical protein